MFRYQINPDSDEPIYRQLVSQIHAQIRSGALKTGTQLPTVREMAEKLHLSCGTVKHVYDRLQEMGDIEMTRRRGTFVKYVRRDTDSRKQQAMYAIDRMIRTLSDLQFSPAEIQIFLNLKMREWGLKWSGVRIAVVTDYTEAAQAITRQLEEIGNVKVNICPFEQLKEYPYNVDEQSDVILSSAADAQKLLLLLPDSDKIIRVAFHAEAADVLALAACEYPTVGILCETDAFAVMVRSLLPSRCTLRKLDQASDTVDALIVPRGTALSDFSRPVYELSYQLDEGSLLYLSERIARIRDERQQWPGALRM